MWQSGVALQRKHVRSFVSDGLTRKQFLMNLQTRLGAHRTLNDVLLSQLCAIDGAKEACKFDRSRIFCKRQYRCSLVSRDLGVLGQCKAFHGLTASAFRENLS